ncbi:DUF2786 domain-containing protein [Streptomyces neyagawaensis]|uniref:DUF2786 domain-containing protein n=1 Tax=Streptomyces neyagawaensis TaxID=42238 RepID=UPI0006E323C2|nr:DUF2786 domain-containing protein [Streptomyces neyagawaensis]MCL6734429.1 DUF2786 domain-containing protein [Streptomyces neyagawaensis]MDE1682058.1 DUF2786 domain-containing protein [Streptomyces neyagawaensis]
MTQPAESLLAKVRALLAKAEDPASTTAEAEAFTAKAAELMAKYGIERAMLADANADTDTPADRIITMDNPWAREKQGLVAGIVEALRGQAVLRDKGSLHRVHMFGYQSDLERAELLYTSLLLQMTQQLAHVEVPWGENARAYRRSWIIGFRYEVVRRIKAAEARAVAEASRPEAASSSGRSTELVLADRKAIIEQRVFAEFGKLKARRTTYRGSGFGDGQAAGRTANIGQTGLRGGRRAIGGDR